MYYTMFVYLLLGFGQGRLTTDGFVCIGKGAPILVSYHRHNYRIWNAAMMMVTLKYM